MVVFDASMLLLMLDPAAKPPLDRRTRQPVDRASERIEFLIETLGRERCKIIIPTPALSELLVRAGTAGPGYLDELSRSARFEIAPFDQRAAVEVAAAIREAIDQGDKREGSPATWAKIKFDHQIVAIARLRGATAIYSDDEDIVRLGQRGCIKVIGLADLPLPPPDQLMLEYGSPTTGAERDATG